MIYRIKITKWFVDEHSLEMNIDLDVCCHHQDEPMGRQGFCFKRTKERGGVSKLNRFKSCGLHMIICFCLRENLFWRPTKI